LLAGAAVAGAGEIRVVDGRLAEMWLSLLALEHLPLGLRSIGKAVAALHAATGNRD